MAGEIVGQHRHDDRLSRKPKCNMLIDAYSSQCQGVVAAGWSLNGRWAVQIANALQMATIASHAPP
jgi:hypothetical protein